MEWLHFNVSKLIWLCHALMLTCHVRLNSLLGLSCQDGVKPLLTYHSFVIHSMWIHILSDTELPATTMSQPVGLIGALAGSVITTSLVATFGITVYLLRKRRWAMVFFLCVWQSSILACLFLLYSVTVGNVMLFLQPWGLCTVQQ